MVKSTKVVERDLQQQKRRTPRQLSVTDLNHLAHGEEKSSMRDGFYTRRNRSQM